MSVHFPPFCGFYPILDCSCSHTMQYSWRLSNILCEAWMVSSKPSQRGAFIQNPALSRCLLGSLAAIISIRKQGNLKKYTTRSQVHESWFCKGPQPSGCWVQASSLRRRHMPVQKVKGHSQHNVPVLSNHSHALSLKGADEQSWALFPGLPPSHRHMPRFFL